MPPVRERPARYSPDDLVHGRCEPHEVNVVRANKLIQNLDAETRGVVDLRLRRHAGIARVLEKVLSDRAHLRTRKPQIDLFDLAMAHAVFLSEGDALRLLKKIEKDAVLAEVLAAHKTRK